MATFHVQVQVDRIFQPSDTQRSVWLAVKIGSFWEFGPQEKTVNHADFQIMLAQMLPWKWLDPNNPGKWNQYDSNSWTIWRRAKNSQPQETWTLLTDTIQFVNNNLSDITANAENLLFSEAPSKGYISRFIDSLIPNSNQGNVEDTSILQQPKATSSARSIPAFLERLAVSPYPLPQLSKTHTLLIVTLGTDVREDDEFLVAPRFAVVDLNNNRHFIQAKGQPSQENDSPTWQDELSSSSSVNGAQGSTKYGKITILPSLSKSDVTPSGGPMDMLHQLVKSSKDNFLATAEEAATLPQRIAIVLDPAARLRSSLSRSLIQWCNVQANTRDIVESLVQGLISKNEGTQNIRNLVKALNFIMIQVLWPYSDTIGRFECPSYSRLSDATSRSLIEKPIINLHRDFADSHKFLNEEDQDQTSAALRISLDIFKTVIDSSNNQQDLKGLALLQNQLPFTPEHLLNCLIDTGYVDSETRMNTNSPVDLDANLTKQIWLALLSEIDRSTDKAISVRARRFEHKPDPSGELLLNVKNVNVDIEPFVPFEGLDSLALESIRSDLAMVFAAPFIEGIVNGRSWDTNKPLPEDKPLAERMVYSLKELIGTENKINNSDRSTIYGTFFGLSKDFQLEPMIEGLFLAILKGMAEETIRLANRIISPSSQWERLTSVPLPLPLAVDTLNTFSRKIDFWTRLSGYGLLAWRQNPSNINRWDYAYSLNAGSILLQGNNQLDYFCWRSTNAAQTSQRMAFVDPIPFAPSDHIGVRDALSEYSNAWLCSSMPGDNVNNNSIASDQDSPFSFLYFNSPSPDDAKLPTLSFGYTYSVAAHLIGIGGVLAHEVRDTKNPYMLKSQIEFPNSSSTNLADIALKPIRYLRTVPISTPTFTTEEISSESQSEIPLLSSEIAQNPPGFILRDQTKPPFAWNLNLYSGRPDQDLDLTLHRGICFEGAFRLLEANQIEQLILQVAGSTPFHVDLKSQNNSVPSSVYGPSRFKQLVRIEIVNSSNQYFVVVSTNIFDILTGKTGPNWLESYKSSISPISPISAINPAILSLNSQKPKSIYFEPWSVTLLSKVNPSSSVSPAPGETQNSSPMTLFLNYIQPDLCKSSLNNLAVSDISHPHAFLSFPTIDRTTWERWVNADFFDSTSTFRPLPQRPEISKRIDPRTDVYRDPAVMGIRLELWEIYPTEQQIGQAIDIARQTRENHLKAYRISDNRINLRVELADSSKTLGLSKPQSMDPVTIKLDARRIAYALYEIRAFSIIEPNTIQFGSISPLDRLGSSVISLLSPTQQSGQISLLSSAARLRIEIASLPDVEQIRIGLKTADVDPVEITASSDSRRFAQVRLPAVDVETYALLRRFQSVYLLPQRWQWRGYPHPPSLTNPNAFPIPKGEQRQPFDSDSAFFGWDDNDLQSLASAQLRPYHLTIHNLDPASVGKSKVALPLLMEKDLDWRGGWQLWRFRLEFQSRYVDLLRLRFQDRCNIITPSKTAWYKKDLLDADNGRNLAPPSLALILPLTESYSKGTRVPPLLAIFNGSMHADSNFGDDVLVFVHSNESNGTIYSQIAPDPVRSTSSYHDQRLRAAIPLRIDGPVGYGFDALSSSPLFGHYGYLVTPVSDALEPWSFVKLTFIRLEHYFGLPLASWTQPTRNSNDWYLYGQTSSPASTNSVSRDGNYLSCTYDGLVVYFRRILDFLKPQQQNLTISIGGSSPFQFTISVKSIKDRAIAVFTPLPSASELEFQCPMDVYPSNVILRLVIIPSREAPTSTVVLQAYSVDPYRLNDALPDRNGWLSVCALPISWSPSVSKDIPKLSLSSSNTSYISDGYCSVFPIRLSAPAEGAWAQFNQASSTFNTQSANDKDFVLADISNIRGVVTNRFSDSATPSMWQSFRLRRTDGDSNLLLRAVLSGPSQAGGSSTNTLNSNPSFWLKEQFLVVFTIWTYDQDLASRSPEIERPNLEQPLLIHWLTELDEDSRKVSGLLNPGNTPPLWSSMVIGDSFIWPSVTLSQLANIRILRVVFSSSAPTMDQITLSDLLPTDLDNENLPSMFISSVSRPAPVQPATEPSSRSSPIGNQNPLLGSWHVYSTDISPPPENTLKYRVEVRIDQGDLRLDYYHIGTNLAVDGRTGLKAAWNSSQKILSWEAPKLNPPPGKQIYRLFYDSTTTYCQVKGKDDRSVLGYWKRI